MPQRIAGLTANQSRELTKLGRDARFTNLRQTGTITAFDLADVSGGYLAGVALKIRQASVNRGVLLRPLGSTIYVMPPYCATGHDLELVYDVIRQAVSEALA